VNKEKMKQQLKELDQKQQDFVQRIGEARDLLAELMFTSDAFFTLQKRELLHHMTASCEHDNRYTKEGIIFCNDCGNTLGFVEESNVIDFNEPIDLSVADGVSTILNKDLLNEPSFLMPSGLTRELRHEWAKGCNTEEPPFNYDLERMKEAVESPTALTLTGEHSQEEIRELLLKAADELVIPEPPKQHCIYLSDGRCHNCDGEADGNSGGCVGFNSCSYMKKKTKKQEPPKQPIPPLARILKEGVLPPIPEIKKINYCPHNDAGWCFAKEDIVTNAVNSGCFKPQECPANQGE